MKKFYFFQFSLVLLIILFTLILLQIFLPQKIVTVIVRKLLIQVIPYWDWTEVYNSDCLLANPFYVKRILRQEDCTLCEFATVVHHTRHTFHNYEDPKDNPFIVLDATSHWEVMREENFWLNNVTEIFLLEKYKDIPVCDLMTNLKLIPEEDNFQNFLTKINDDRLQNWFGHWENCDRKGAKALRLFYRRPYFVPNIVDLTAANWVLLSSNYNDDEYYSLDYRTELICLVQIRGWNHIRIVPREPCGDLCPDITDSLTEGQILVVKSFMWKLSYRPGQNTDNFAIAIGGYWN